MVGGRLAFLRSPGYDYADTCGDLAAELPALLRLHRRVRAEAVTAREMRRDLIATTDAEAARFVADAAVLLAKLHSGTALPVSTWDGWAEPVWCTRVRVLVGRAVEYWVRSDVDKGSEAMSTDCATRRNTTTDGPISRCTVCGSKVPVSDRGLRAAGEMDGSSGRLPRSNTDASAHGRASHSSHLGAQGLMKMPCRSLVPTYLTERYLPTLLSGTYLPY